MANVNRGKDFEAQIRTGLESTPNTSVTRLLDPMSGYAGVRNICDFIVYKYPNQYFFECKCHYGNTLPFSCITQNQWDGMLQQSKVAGVVAGVLMWYIDHDVTVFIPIQVLEEERMHGKKSINIKDINNLDVIKIYGKKKRIMFDYDFDDFFDKIFLFTDIDK